MAVHFGQLPHLPLVCIDNFKSRSGSARKFFFLTHFHADHYLGLTDTFDDGFIYCSHRTKKLILNKFPKISPSKIVTHISLEVGVCRCLQLTEDVTINVTFFDSNHCPGSDLSGRLFWSLSTHRYCAMDTSSVKRFVDCDRLILDTTFAHPLWKDFPSKDEAIQQIITIIEDHDETRHVLLECDMLGTEEILFQLAKHFNCEIHVDKERCKELECIDPSASFFSTDPKSSRFHVVPSGTCETMLDSFNQRKTNPKRYKRSNSRDVSYLKDEDSVLLIKPSTQWFGMNGRQPSKYLHAPCLVDGIWHVLYSIHSSYSEIIEFLQQVQPRSITALTECEPEVLKMINRYATNQISSQEVITPPSLLKECQISSTQYSALHVESKMKINNLKKETVVVEKDELEFGHVSELLNSSDFDDDDEIFFSQSKLTSIAQRRKVTQNQPPPVKQEPAIAAKEIAEDEHSEEDELFLSQAKISTLIKKETTFKRPAIPELSSPSLEETDNEDIFLTQLPKETKYATPSPSPVSSSGTTSTSPVKCSTGTFFPSPSPTSSPATLS